MAGGTAEKKRRLLQDVIQEFRTKVVEAAQRLQRQLADSAAQLAVAVSSTDRADEHGDLPAGEDPLLAELTERQLAEQSATASSSAGRAEESGTSRRSAEQPATSLHLKISSILDVQAWLNGEQVASCSSADAQRIREAAAVLTQNLVRRLCNLCKKSGRWQNGKITSRGR